MIDPHTRLREIEKMIADGLRQDEIARRLNVAPSALSGLRTVLDLPCVHRERRSARVDEYRLCAAEGLTMTEAAKRLGVTISAVHHVASRNGITFVRSPLLHGQRPDAQASP